MQKKNRRLQREKAKEKREKEAEKREKVKAQRKIRKLQRKPKTFSERLIEIQEKYGGHDVDVAYRHLQKLAKDFGRSISEVCAEYRGSPRFKGKK